MNTISIGDAMLKLVASDLLPAFEESLTIGTLAAKDFEPHIARAGDSVNVPIARDLSTGGFGNARILLTTELETSFAVPDVTKVLAVPDLLRLYMAPAVLALVEQVERDIVGLFPQFIHHGMIETRSIGEKEIDAIETTLFDAGVPARHDKYFLVDASAYASLRALPRWSDFAKWGTIKNLMCFRSPLVTHKEYLAFGRGAIGMATRRVAEPLAGSGINSVYAEGGGFGFRIASCGVHGKMQQFELRTLYGVGVLRNKNGVRVKG